MSGHQLVWPTSGTGRALADVLRHAAAEAGNASSGNAAQVVDRYLNWATEQVRLLRPKVSSADLARLITTPRYWATANSPEPTPSTVRAVGDELSHQAQALEAASREVRNAAESWAPLNGEFSSLLLVDTSSWMEHVGSFGALDWCDLISKTDGPGTPTVGDELRIVVPILVIDELDGLTHKGTTRQKAAGVSKYLYGLLGYAGAKPVRLDGDSHDRDGGVRIQLLMDPSGHVRMPISDEELVARAVALRDFAGFAPRQCFFLTYDTGAAFRAAHAGLMPRLLSRT